MARLRVDVFSDVLGMNTSLTILMPWSTTTQIGQTDRAVEGDPPVLYLLHGLSDDDTIWTRRTSLERYVAPLGLAVVMPQVQRSFYTDQVHGLRYWTFLSEELPDMVARLVRVSAKREDTFVAGLSMGGYGAFKWALSHPDRFAAAASLSGALHLGSRDGDPTWAGLAEATFGRRPISGTPNDVLWLLDQALASGGPVPALYVACGEDDPLLRDNHAFVAAAEGRVPSLTTDFGPGIHDWAYWDRTIQDVLAWLPLASAGGAVGAVGAR